MTVLSLPTTIVAVACAIDLIRRAGRGRPQVAWWAMGALVYGTGTAAAWVVDRYGWSPAAFRVWYVAGAVLGGAVLALGTVHLVHRPSVARQVVQSVATIAAGAAIAVTMAPVRPLPDGALGGASIGWVWVRALTPPLNVFAVVYLVGGALRSAVRYARRGEGTRPRVLGNVLIALGGITPALGGLASRLGGEGALPPTLLAGVVMIWAGARLAARPIAG